MTDRPFEPQVFGSYYLLEHIAYGGMAEIYRAKSFGASGFERELVLKRVLPKLVENPDFLRMLTNEAKLTATLQHGNIAQVFELGLEGGTYFMTMEYVEGVSMKSLLREVARAGKVLPPQIGAYLVMQIAQGLHYAHEKTDPMGKALAIVHCDISPENVVVGFDGNVKIVDFGIARAQASFSNYKEGMVMGKFNYVAPEQAMGRPLDRRADIFSAGIILYEALTGQHPFGRKGDVDTLVRIARFTKGEVEPPMAVTPGLAQTISELTMTAMAHDLRERYATAQAFAEALAAFVNTTPRAQLHEQLKTLLQQTFTAQIAERRKARSRDPEIIRELQRLVASQVDQRETSEPALVPVFSPAAGRQGAGGKGRLLAAGGLLVGLLLGAGAMQAMTPAPSPLLFVDSTPPGAQVTLEGAERGRTPLLLPLEASTPYLLQLALPGYEPASETFTAEGTLIERKVTLKAKLARLEVVSDPPGARVEIDQADRGVTPLAIDLPVGEAYRVRVSLGAAVEERQVELLGAGTRLQVDFSVRRAPEASSSKGKKRPGKKRRRKGRRGRR